MIFFGINSSLNLSQPMNFQDDSWNFFSMINKCVISDARAMPSCLLGSGSCFTQFLVEKLKCLFNGEVVKGEGIPS